MNDETSKWLLEGYATPKPSGLADQDNQKTLVKRTDSLGTGNVSTDSANKSWRNTIGERYKIRNRIAETGASFVYEAWDEFRQLRVAIKELRLPKADAEELADLVSRFEESAEITRHPRIVEVKKFLEIDGRYYIVMEFMDAGSLDDRVKRIEQQPLTLEDIKTVMNDLFAALEHSHQSKIIHRDVKPANILLSSTTGWKLTDFGIARIMSSTRTQDGTFLGTPAYSSPEQVKGLLVDERTDVYSCGVVLYELLAGQRPFRGGEDTVKRKIVYQEPVPPSTLGKLSLPALDKVVARAMAKDRDQRYPTIAAFREAMDAALRTPAIKVPPPTGPGTGPGPVIDLNGGRPRLLPPDPKPRPGPWIIVTLAGLITLSAAGYFTWRVLPGLLPPLPKPQSMPASKPSQELPAPTPAPLPARPKLEPIPAPPSDYLPPSTPSYPPPPSEPAPAPPIDHAPLSAPSYPPEPAPPVNHAPPPAPSYPPEPAPAPPVNHAPPPASSYPPPPKPVPAPPRPPSPMPNYPRRSPRLRGLTTMPCHSKPVPPSPVKPSEEHVLKPPAPQASGLEVGLLCTPVTLEQVKYLDISDTDVPLVKVQGVTNGLAADKAGVRPGDVLQKTGDLSTRSEFTSQCLVTLTGGRAVVKVWRNHAWQPFTIRSN